MKSMLLIYIYFKVKDSIVIVRLWYIISNFIIIGEFKFYLVFVIFLCG